MSTQQQKTASRKPFWLGVISGVLGLSIAGGTLAAGFGGHHGCGMHGSWRTAHYSPEQIQGRADFAAEWVLRYVDASPEQEAQIKGIIDAVLADIQALKSQHQQNRQAFLDALSQPQVNRLSLQQIRADELALAEAASTRIIDAVADIAQALTPEQRAELAELVQRFHHER